MTIPSGTGIGVHVCFANGRLQFSKSVQACTHHTCVFFSAGKFIAFGATSFLTDVKSIAKRGANVKFSRLSEAAKY
jgi:hypothetical protein